MLKYIKYRLSNKYIEKTKQKTKQKTKKMKHLYRNIPSNNNNITKLNIIAQRIERNLQYGNKLNNNSKYDWIFSWISIVLVPHLKLNTYANFIQINLNELKNVCNLSDRKIGSLNKKAKLLDKRKTRINEKNIIQFTNEFIKVGGIEVLMCLGI